MALNSRLDIGQSQSLVMTPQLQQAIKLLQLSNIDLQEFIETEISSNPMLDWEESTLEDSSKSSEDFQESSNDSDSDASSKNDLDSVDYLKVDSSGDLNQENLDTDYTNDFDVDFAGAGSELESNSYDLYSNSNTNASSQFSGNSQDNIFDTIGQKKSLRQHLIEQITLDITEPIERAIAILMLDHLTPEGWFSSSLELLSEQLQVSIEIVDTVLKKLQQMDPIGIFATDLTECLRIQLKHAGKLDDKMSILLNNLDAIAEAKINRLIRKCKTNHEGIHKLISCLRELQPKPAEGFNFEEVDVVIPDVILKPGRTPNSWLIELNGSTIPHVQINQDFYQQLGARKLPKNEQQYFSEHFQNARWLQKSLEQRSSTILKVTHEIVKQQAGFFQFGITHLRPLILRDIADAVELHESTISRVTANKYIATPRGVYELKFFFTSSLSSAGGNSTISAESVRHTIKELINDETSEHILSDDAIVEHLLSQGIDIARRTVAKYREAMKIPSSVQRRKNLRMNLR